MSLLTARRNLPALASVALVCALLTPDAAAECPAAAEGVDAIESTFIRAVTLNVAHGRKDGRNQMLLGEETIRSNLVEVADFLDRSEADVIALQEVDAERTLRSMDKVEALVAMTGADFWLQHDASLFDAQQKAPGFYE